MSMQEPKGPTCCADPFASHGRTSGRLALRNLLGINLSGVIIHSVCESSLPNYPKAEPSGHARKMDLSCSQDKRLWQGQSLLVLPEQEGEKVGGGEKQSSH